MAFLWVTHQVAMTRWVKREVAANAPDLRFAFARPGLTTFKVEGRMPARVPTSFARAWGASLGRAETVEQVAELAAPHLGGPVRLHVFEREIDVPVDEQDAAVRGTRAAAVEPQLRAAMPGLLPEPRARIGDRVLDVVVPHAAEPDEPWLVGMHEHDESHGPWPGGVPYVPAPPEAPSRAWSKLEEALRWADLEPRPGEIAVELGSSPGGASRALLDRGLVVYGVDPGEMDPRVLASDRFVHLQLPAAEVPKRALPRSYEWLALDVNLAPMIALRYVERFVALAHGGLRGALLTLKINDDGIFEALPRLYERIARLGAASVRVTQLPSHRSEVVAILAW